MHRLSELAEIDWLRYEEASPIPTVPETPDEPNPDREVASPAVRTVIGEPVERKDDAFRRIVCDARDPDEDEDEDDLDYLYDDEDEDLDDDLDEDLEDFEEEEEEFEEEDEDL